MINKIFKENFKIIIIILLIFILILLFLINKICNNESSLNYYIYDSNKPGKTIAIIGGTHGNEPIGSIVIKNLIEKINKKEITLKSGKLILIPDVNYCALRIGIRMIPSIGDINRKYPKNIYDKSNCPINNKIINLLNNADFVLDFHEGWGFHRLNKKSMGSSITPTDSVLSNDIANYLYNQINLTITDPKKKFIIFVNDDRYIKNPLKYSQLNDIKGSLRYYQNINNKNYVLIEITGQNNIQTLDIRIQQANTILKSTLSYFKII